MSFDFHTLRICPHEVILETLVLDQDHITSSFQKPPSNSHIKVYFDGSEIPSGGLYGYASIPFSKAEPYRIKKGVNDLIYISTGFDAPRFISVISGSVSAIDMARCLQQKLPEFKIEVKNSRIVISSRVRGKKTAFQFHDPRWTDSTSSLLTTAQVLATYKILGIIPGRAATGRLLIPGWSVQTDPNDILHRNKILIFNFDIKNKQPLIQVSYVTTAVDCRRCHGTRFEFDYQIENNNYTEIRNIDLLAQEFDKFLFTKIGSHWKWNWLGSGLVNRIGGKGSTGSTMINAILTVDVSQAFSTYQNIKSQQDVRFPQQKVSDAEYPQQLGNIDVQTLPNDPTVAIITTTVISRSSVDVPLTRMVGDPSPFSLSGNPTSNIRLQPGKPIDFRSRG